MAKYYILKHENKELSYAYEILALKQDEKLSEKQETYNELQIDLLQED
jgi:hypothetical protein